MVIWADNRRSSTEETTAGLGFKLLDKAQSKELDSYIEWINMQGLSPVEAALARADIYLSYRLISEAIQTLESDTGGDKTAEVYRLLGDLYRQIGLVLEAEVEYLQALDVARTEENDFEIAAVQAGLGEVNYALGRREEALRFLESARQGYESLEDTERVDVLKERLERING